MYAIVRMRCNVLKVIVDHIFHTTANVCPAHLNIRVSSEPPRVSPLKEGRTDWKVVAAEKSHQHRPLRLYGHRDEEPQLQAGQPPLSTSLHLSPNEDGGRRTVNM